MNKRLRKKKRVGEFQELGFNVSFYIENSSEEIIDKLFEDFISFVESNKLSIGGGFNGKSFSFFVCLGSNRGSCTEEHRKLINEWLVSYNVTNIIIGQLIDCWYGYK